MPKRMAMYPKEQYQRAQCANFDCPDPDGGAKPGESKVFVLPDVQTRRGYARPRFRIELCTDCYKKYDQEREA